MDNQKRSREDEELATLRREREKLTEQIRQNQQTIEHSQQLLRQIDELLARFKSKPKAT
jgi:hypothetical protein